MPLRISSHNFFSRATLGFLLISLVAQAFAVRIEGQPRPIGGGRAHNPGLPGWCETPVDERKEEGGCYTTAILDVGVLPSSPIFWHLDTFPTRAAAEANRAPRSIVVDSLKRHWLFTVAEEGWHPAEVNASRSSGRSLWIETRHTPHDLWKR
jgi:hypothetical protein